MKLTTGINLRETICGQNVMCVELTNRKDWCSCVQVFLHLFVHIIFVKYLKIIQSVCLLMITLS